MLASQLHKQVGFCSLGETGEVIATSVSLLTGSLSCLGVKLAFTKC